MSGHAVLFPPMLPGHRASRASRNKRRCPPRTVPSAWAFTFCRWALRHRWLSRICQTDMPGLFRRRASTLRDPDRQSAQTVSYTYKAEVVVDALRHLLSSDVRTVKLSLPDLAGCARRAASRRRRMARNAWVGAEAGRSLLNLVVPTPPPHSL